LKICGDELTLLKFTCIITVRVISDKASVEIKGAKVEILRLKDGAIRIKNSKYQLKMTIIDENDTLMKYIRDNP
jgi:hypothetical protein